MCAMPFQSIFLKQIIAQILGFNYRQPEPESGVTAVHPSPALATHWWSSSGSSHPTGRDRRQEG